MSSFKQSAPHHLKYKFWKVIIQSNLHHSNVL